MENNESTPQPIIKEEKNIPQVPEPEPAEGRMSIETTDASKETILKVSDSPKGLQGPSPPSFNNSKSNPVGLGIDTTVATEDLAPATAELPQSSVDSLFGILDSGNNDSSDVIFDGIEFLDSSNTQGHNNFDLSTFGNSQDFNMPDLQTANDGENTNNSSGNKQDDIFDLENASGGGDTMDLDLDLSTVGGVNSTFDDIFFGSADDGNIDGGEMVHGDYDSTFFGLN